MRRRLWWALVHFDARISDMIQSKSSTFSSIWDCKVPLNVNDSDLDPGLKKPPSNRDMPTEATFIAIRGIIADHVRATSSHLDFINPASRPLAKNAQIDLASGNRNSVASLEQTIEDKYLSVCDLDNSVQFMTVWMARGLLAKYHLLEQYSKLLNVPTPPTDMQHDNANMHALKMLECDTNITRSPLTKRYLWMAHIYFPFPAYLQLFQDCKRRPLSLHIQRGWEALSENYIARREAFHQHEDNSLFRILAELVLQAWKARISALRNEGETTIAEPHLVSHVKERLARFSSNTTSRTTNGAVALNPHDIVTSDCAVSTHHLDMTNNMLEPQALVGLTSMEYPAQSGMYGMTLDSLGWAAMDWSFGSSPNGY